MMIWISIGNYMFLHHSARLTVTIKAGLPWSTHSYKKFLKHSFLAF